MGQSRPRSWRKTAFQFLVSQCVTLFGSTLVQMAIVWYVTLNTASGAWVAAFSVCSYLPQFLLSFAGGVFADRYSRKWLIAGADAAIAAVTLLMILVIPHIRETETLLSALLLISALRSAGAGIQTPAVSAVIPSLVPETELMRFNGLNAAMQSLVNFAAPAAAGALLTVSSLRLTMGIDVLTAVVGIGMVLGIRIPGNDERKCLSAWEDLKMGIGCVRSHWEVGNLLTVYGLFTILCVPAGFLAGLLVSRVYGDDYWYLTAVELVGFAGMVAGGLLMSVWGGCSNRRTTLAAALGVFGAMAAGMGIVKSFVLYLLLMGLYGVALTAVQTAVTTMVQEGTPAAVQGRVFGLMSSVYSGCLPLGMAVFGPLADLIPLQGIMIFSGAALLAFAFLVYDGGNGRHRERRRG